MTEDMALVIRPRQRFNTLLNRKLEASQSTSGMVMTRASRGYFWTVLIRPGNTVEMIRAGRPKLLRN